MYYYKCTRIYIYYIMLTSQHCLLSSNRAKVKLEKGPIVTPQLSHEVWGKVS